MNSIKKKKIKKDKKIKVFKNPSFPHSYENKQSIKGRKQTPITLSVCPIN